MTARPPLWGLVAEFEGPTALLEAAERAREAGYARLDAYVPFPVEGLSEALGFRRTALPLLVLVGALVGAAGGYFMQWYAMAVWYPLNVGGRPLNSWPMFIPITFELAVLVGGLTAVIGMLALNGLPMPYHPVFNVEQFELASRNRFFLCIEAADALFDRDRTAKFLEGFSSGVQPFGAVLHLRNSLLRPIDQRNVSWHACFSFERRHPCLRKAGILPAASRF